MACLHSTHMPEWPCGPSSVAGHHSAHPDRLPAAFAGPAGTFPVRFYYYYYFFGNKKKSLFAQNRRYSLCSPQCSCISWLRA